LRSSFRGYFVVARGYHEAGRSQEKAAFWPGRGYRFEQRALWVCLNRFA
jgi:hypothetical protein